MLVDNNKRNFFYEGNDCEFINDLIINKTINYLSDKINDYKYIKALKVFVIKSFELNLLEKLGNVIFSECKYGEDSIYIEDDLCIYQFEYSKRKSYNILYIKFYTKEFNNIEDGIIRINNIINKYKSNENNVECEIVWYYYTGGNIRSVEFYELLDDVIHEEAYPFLKGGLKTFVKDYLESKESILVLLGEPGTGKTRLIRYILLELSKSVDSISRICYTSNAKVLEEDSIFISFVDSDYDALVLEDIDNHLKDRSSNDNNVMYNFLTTSDGLVLNNDKKIIFSTNLNSISDIDKALIRPGRCFAVINFRKLKKNEAIKLLSKLNNTYNIELDKNEYTLAEIYQKVNVKNEYYINNNIKGIGF